MVFQQAKVNVVHGSLAFAQYPVAIGHYYGDIISSAEAYLNRCLDDRLKQRYQLGLYPGEIETVAVLLNPDEYAKPGGAIVVGLGKVGELTPESLTRSFAHAALSYALAVAERTNKQSGTKPRSAAISTLLMGTGPGGLSVEDSVTAILRGVYRANLALESIGNNRQVVIDAIEFMELWEDLAILVSRSLEQVSSDPELRNLFDFSEPCIQQAPGGQVRVAFNDPTNWWRRLQILGDDDGSLQFNMMTDRARSEITLLATQSTLVDGFINTAIRNTGREERIGKTLFELLIPNSLKEQVPNRQNLVLILNEEAAHYPWELLEDHLSDDGRPLAVEAGVVRQLETPIFRGKVSITPENKALVIGDPKSSLVSLPAAQVEAQLVRGKLLDRGYKVETKIGATALDIVEALYADAYRVLHLSGHGIYNKEFPGKDKKVSGMVIGDDIFLTPRDVEQMRQIPELVFINCCHLGRIDGEKNSERDTYHKLAANLAMQFIQMGVRAVVAAGWAVDDDAANTFADRFYEEILSGTPFGYAVLRARRETYEKQSGVNTWGAYQCYGDPGYSLCQSPTRSNSIHREMCFHAPSEAIAELNNLTSDAATASQKQVAELHQRLQKLTEHLPNDWLKLAGVRAALGSAYGELELFREAIDNYERVLAAEKADFPLRVIEQLADFRGQWAMELWRATPKEAVTDSSSAELTEPCKQIDQAIALLQHLCEIGSTVERLSLLGSAYKRKACITVGQERRDALETMRNIYMEAYELAQKIAGEVDPDPLLKWLAAEVVLLWSKSDRNGHVQQQLYDQLKQVEALAENCERRNSSIWNMTLSPECALIRHLAQENLEAHAAEVVQGYNAIRFRRASPQDFRLVLEHLEFFMEMAKSEAGNDIRKEKLGEALQNIYKPLSLLATQTPASDRLKLKSSNN